MIFALAATFWVVLATALATWLFGLGLVPIALVYATLTAGFLVFWRGA